ncbi:MAG TPA: MraY family glycosyltransferase [Candidatus Krumholzibacterium sp.]|nr:MraY family glycosyltransferase [Candidatus Krumholzibacterium sp.]
MVTSAIVTPFLLSFVLGMFFTPLAIGLAVRWRICDKPNGRTSRDIAHIGGVAIIGAMIFALIPVFLFLIPQSPLNRVFVPILVASGFLTFLLGIIDDLRSLHYIYKLFFQIAVSVLVSACGVCLLEHFGLTSMSLPVALSAFGASSVWMLTIMTSFNLIDGIDGLASGIAIISAGAFLVAGMIFGHPIVIALSSVLIGASLAFLRYNFPPARIFMGDSGSLFIGLMFGLTSLLMIIPGRDILYRIPGCIMILSLPLLDTLLAFLRRVMTGRPPFEADHMHLHHILLYRLGSMRKVDSALWTLSAAFGVLGLITMKGSLTALLIGAALEVTVFVFALRNMVSLDIPIERIDELLDSYRVSPPRMLSRED